MSAETERKLLEWENGDHYTIDDLFSHFKEFDRWTCFEVSEEARRINNLMFKENVESDSPLDGIWAAASYQAAYGAFAAVAAALGVDVKALQRAIEPWYEFKDDLPDSISATRLLELCEEEAKNFHVNFPTD